jgi:RHS repeat-associated protein
LGEGQTSAAIVAALPANLQYVWGLRNVNDLVLRDSAASGGNLGISGSGLGLRLYALQDANWNVVALVSTTGAVVERFSYSAFGTATALNPNFSAPYSGTNFQWTRLFAGMDVDEGTGLYYDNARWYNSSLGIFVTTDPAMADPNTYRYAGNNPVTATDPSGLALPIEWWWDDDLNNWVDINSGRTPEDWAAVRAVQAKNNARALAAALANSQRMADLRAQAIAAYQHPVFCTGYPGQGIVKGFNGHLRWLFGPSAFQLPDMFVFGPPLPPGPGALPRGFIQTGPNTWEGTIEVEIPEP